ncbi:MAG: hypothetical protein EBW69_05855 [Nitrosomonadales bacterium]|nr:hypothetical protein [Nitrosomonadales bacterium]
MRLFGTDGIRGEVGKYPLTAENILKLAKASSLVLKKKQKISRVVINKDYEICLSGSGSAMFIKYNNAQEKEKILKIIPSNWRFFLAKPLQYSPLREFV